MEGDQEERTFLFGYQHTRGYGSLSNPQTSTKAYRTIVQHHIGPYDTLQGLVLKYNTSLEGVLPLLIQMSEIKRLNRLWSNESLHLKEYVDIPIYDEVSEQFPNSARSLTITGNSLDKTSSKSKEMDSESVNDIFKRIDMNIRKTTDNVYKLAKSSV
ncbi:unnamed protein product [Thelazia callipaeda]|uniref:LysM domain-containing protein n=1 Tax=Thelazia callipaeda TaxID=103827 RepID=A0A0N5D445_THECL|nr:unnamed protein product [Thelazia callipaeda]